jgi:predicted nucleic acid-binding protein
LAESVRRDLAARGDALAAPHLLDIEVISAMRRLLGRQTLDSHRGAQILSNLADIPAERYPHTWLLDRIWELRHNFTPYDAVYIALAEQTGAILYTCDAKLCKGHRARVSLFTH